MCCFSFGLSLLDFLLPGQFCFICFLCSQLIFEFCSCSGLCNKLCLSFCDCFTFNFKFTGFFLCNEFSFCFSLLSLELFLVVNGSFLSVFLFYLFSCNLSIEHFLNFKLLFHFDAFQGLLFHFEHGRLRSSVCLEVAASSCIWLPFSFCFNLFKFFVVLNQNFYLLVSCFNSCIKFNLGDFWRPIFRVYKLVYSWIDKFFKQNTCATKRFN